jgi:hypothetical protein
MSSTPHVSRNGIWSIRLLQYSEHRCRLEVTKDNELNWTLDRCVGTADDRYFIGDAGQRFWVIHAFPKVPSKKLRGRPTRWGKVVVAEEFDRLGKRLVRRKLAQFVGRRQVFKLRDLGSRFVWLQGVNRVPGQEPRLDGKGVVELDTVAGKTFRLKF